MGGGEGPWYETSWRLEIKRSLLASPDFPPRPIALLLLARRITLMEPPFGPCASSTKLSIYYNYISEAVGHWTTRIHMVWFDENGFDQDTSCAKST